MKSIMKLPSENKEKDRGVQTFTFTSTLSKLNPQGALNGHWLQEYQTFLKKPSIIEATCYDMDKEFFLSHLHTRQLDLI